MFAYVILVAVAIAATFHNINGKPEAKYSPRENEMLDNHLWPKERMEIMEKQMKLFVDIIREQGQNMEKAEKEIDNLKATTQRKGAEMKVL